MASPHVVRLKAIREIQSSVTLVEGDVDMSTLVCVKEVEDDRKKKEAEQRAKNAEEMTARRDALRTVQPPRVNRVIPFAPPMPVPTAPLVPPAHQ